jgi:hypothetical protein
MLETLSLLASLEIKNSEIKEICKGNEHFLMNLQLFENGGVFSKEEVQWYADMMKDIDDKIAIEIKERERRIKELEKTVTDRKTEMIKLFEDKYVIALEDLSAKDGTGKKYGKPRRVAQERLRAEMTKCEKSQECIEKLIKELRKRFDLFETASHFDIMSQNPSLPLQIRKIMMTVRACIARYAIHIEALKPTCPVGEMPRVSYNEEKFDLVMDEKELEEVIFSDKLFIIRM